MGHGEPQVGSDAAVAARALHTEVAAIIDTPPLSPTTIHIHVNFLLAVIACLQELCSRDQRTRGITARRFGPTLIFLEAKRSQIE